MVFYTEGENLWRFNFEKFEESFNEKKKPESKSLAEAREALTSGAAGVLGTLGDLNRKRLLRLFRRHRCPCGQRK